MNRLYLQVYVTLVASLALFALLTGLLWRYTADEHGARDFAGFASEVVEAMLPPPTGTAAEQEAALRRWSERLRARFTLYDAAGRRIAAAGRPLALPREGAERPRRGRWVLQLPDGRTLVAARERESRGPPLVGFAFALVLLALAVAVGAYPVVRRVTRRLERLQHGVEALGAGDFTARVEVRGRDEVARLAEQFNRSAAEIERLVGAHRTLLANASHELRSPLARIRMAIEARGADPAMRDEVARDIAELDSLIDEILLASRLDAVRERGPQEDVDLLALAAEEAARTEATAEGEPVVAKGEARLLRRMIRNLLENARRHAPGVPAEIRVRRAVGGAELEVLDRGPGVSDAERERIFEPFYRPVGTREGEGGHGLGLALVRQIARHHGGDAACRAREGGGSRFVVTLPAAR